MPTEISGSTGVNKIQDNTIVNADINSSAAIAGSKLVMPAGSVIQVLSTQTMASISTTSDAYQAAGWYLDITPISTSSKILATLSGGGQYVGNSAGVNQYVTIYRDSTNLGDSTHGLSRFGTPGGSWSLVPHSISALDSPSSTSSLRYQPYFKRTGNSGTAYFSHDDRGTITFTLMEIAG